MKLMEEELLRRINRSRRRRLKPPLRHRRGVGLIAEAWSQNMARENRLYHNPLLSYEVENWNALSENVGYAWSVKQVHQTFMKSPGHRANILGNYKYIGLGIVKKDTKLWATEIFYR